MAERSISPPPRKRQKISIDDETLTARSSTSGETSEGAITIYSWNVNGITPFLQPSVASYFKTTKNHASSQSTARASLPGFLERHAWPTLLFLQEVKINPDDSATIRAVENAVRRQSSESLDAYDYEAHFCLPSDKYNACGFGRKVYGVCSIIRKDFRDKLVEKVRPVSWDNEGRILVIETKAVGNIPKLAIFNIYAVNGTDLPYKDPNTGEVTGSRHDRKLQVHVLLQAECQDLEAQGFGVILAGDMNIARSRIDGYPNLRTFPKQHCVNRADLEARFFSKPSKSLQHTDNQHAVSAKDKGDGDSGLDMVDTFRHLYPERKSYTFYPRMRSFGDSCDRVDMIMISRSLEHSLGKAGMHETPSELGPSDHVPLYAQLEFDRLDVATPEARNVEGSNACQNNFDKIE